MEIKADPRHRAVAFFTSAYTLVLLILTVVFCKNEVIASFLIPLSCLLVWLTPFFLIAYGRTFRLDENGCTVILGKHKRSIAWQEFPHVYRFDYSHNHHASLGLHGGVAFSAKPIKHPMRILPHLYCYLHPRSFVYINFIDSKRVKGGRNYIDSYCANETELMAKLDKWGVTIGGTFTVGKETFTPSKDCFAVRSNEWAVISGYALLLYPIMLLLAIILGWHELSPLFLAILSILCIIGFWYSIASILAYGRTFTFNQNGCTVSLGRREKHYGWDELTYVRLFDYRKAPLFGSLGQMGSIVFSTTAMKTPKWFSPTKHSLLHPLTYVYVNFRDPNRPNLTKRGYLDDYCVDKEVFLQYLDEWGVEVQYPNA